MPYDSLRDFIARLEAANRLVRVAAPVSPHLEMTEIQTRLLAEQGPAALFENVVDESSRNYAFPVLVNLFGTVARVAAAIGRTPSELREVGETLAFLRQPEPPGSLREAWEHLPLLKTVMAMKPKSVGTGPCSASRRVWISVISSTGETGAATRLRRPVRSSSAMKSRSEA